MVYEKINSYIPSSLVKSLSIGWLITISVNNADSNYTNQPALLEYVLLSTYPRIFGLATEGLW